MWCIYVERVHTGAVTKLNLRDEYARFLARKFLVLLVALVGIVLLAGVAVTLGSAHITPVEVYSCIMARFFPDYFQTNDFLNTIV
jgi:iron complex transport system permease protein